MASPFFFLTPSQLTQQIHRLANTPCLPSRSNLVPRALFPGFGGGASHKAREKRPGDEVVPVDPLMALGRVSKVSVEG